MQIHRFALVTTLLGFFGLPFANAAVRYVNVNRASPSPLYTNWATAVRIIPTLVQWPA